MTPELASYWLLAIWYVTWWVPALWSPKAVARPPSGTSILDRIVVMVGVAALFWAPVIRAGGPVALTPLWTAPSAVGWALFAGEVASIAFCWWARVHMGRLWSGLVTAKADHHIVDTGPFRMVRHPIYTGVIAAAVFLGLIKATPVALVGAALFLVGFWMTARKEEVFLRQQLGAEAYDAYARVTPMFFALPR